MNCKECYPDCPSNTCFIARKVRSTPGKCDPCRLESSDIKNGTMCHDATCPKAEVIFDLKKSHFKENKGNIRTI